MDPNTLTLYAVAGILSLAICLVLHVFAHYQPGTRLIRYWIIAITLQSTGFVIAGMGAHLPRWTMMIVANLLLLSAGPVLYAIFAAFCRERPIQADRAGWALLLASLPAFAYWGLIEPNGHYRSAVFSLAAALINGRTALLIWRHQRQHTLSPPLAAIGLLFGVLTAWMLVRAGVNLTAETPSPELRAANPTTWLTVFGYLLMISAVSICAMWMETFPVAADAKSDASQPEYLGLRSFFRNKLLMLWSAVILQIVVTFGLLGLAYGNFYQSEKTALESAARRANESMAIHTQQVTQQVDVVLRAVREHFRETGSTAKTDQFIKSLKFDRSMIHNIYVIDAAGAAIVAPGENAAGRNAAHRDFFLYHRDEPADKLFIGPVDRGQVTGKYHFRISRRIDGPDGRFAGLILAAVIPEILARHYREMHDSHQVQIGLLGTLDQKLRVRIPEPQQENWQQPITSPLWELLPTAPEGSYRNISAIDGVMRTYHYKSVTEAPLVLVSGYADSVIVHNVYAQMHWLVLIALAILGFSTVFAMLLTIELQRREEQDHFMSMLSHELKTPLSVIRMTVGTQSLPVALGNRVDRAVTDIRNVIERCLQTDRLHHDRVTVAIAPCRIGDLLQDLRQTSRDTDRVLIETGDLPEITTDVQLLTVIMHNLIDNALKYGAPDQPVRIKASRQALRHTPGLLIRIANPPGPATGMPDAIKVFSKYYRAPGAYCQTGSGLGLHVAAGFARKLHGRLDYKPDNGTVCFDLWIPY